MNPMHFITVLDVENEEIKYQSCIGYFESYEEARQVVEENRYDIYEATYDYVVIESVPTGIYQKALATHWFKMYQEGYAKIEEPKFAEDFLGIAIGG